MDFSQLPKMSNTPTPPPPDKEPAPTHRPAAPIPYASPNVSTATSGLGFAGVWISLISGFLCLFMGLTFGKWALATMRGEAFATGVGWELGPKAGQPVDYFELQGGTAWTDAGLFLMGIALLLDAAIMLVAFRGAIPHRGLVGIAAGVTALALFINLGVTGYLMSIGILPILSMIALLVGGMVLFDHLPMLKQREEPR